MKNILILILLIGGLIFAIIKEPIDDVIDTFAGATTESFNPAIDGSSGASLHDDEDDEEDEEDEIDEEDEDERR